MGLSITIVTIIKLALCLLLYSFTKNPVYFMHASNDNYLPIIYFNPILLPKV